MAHNPPYKSETKTFVSGATLDIDGFVPITGPKGGRTVIDKFIVCLIGTLTVGTATFNGADVVRLLQLINVVARDGRNRWTLSGYKSRIASIMFNGIEQHTEHASIVAGAGAAVDMRLIIPMNKRKVVRGKDFALPADLFKKISLTFGSAASAATGTTVLSALALQVYVLAEWHEEMNYEFKAEDSVQSADFNSSTQVTIAPQGTVHDLFVVKEGTTAGGDLITAITDARIEALGFPTLTRQDLVYSYRMKNNLGASGPTTPATERYLEPVTSGMALPVIASDDDTSLWDGKKIPSLKLDVGTGAAGLSVVSREILDKSQSNFNTGVAMYGIDPRNLRMKTAGKTKRGLQEWGQKERLVGVWSAPLPKAS